MQNSGRYAFIVKKECRKESMSCREVRSRRGNTIGIELKEVGYENILVGDMSARVTR